MPDIQKQRRLEVLQRRAERARDRVLRLTAIESRFPWVRLGTLALLLAGILLAAQFLPWLALWAVIFLSVGVFAAVAVRHQRVIDQISRVQTFRRMLEEHIARAQVRWAGIPPPSALSVPAEHPFAADLYITGDSSLHQLLDTTTSLGGSRVLAGWLLDPVLDPGAIHARQSLIRELMGAPAFRSRLEVNGMMANPTEGSRWNADALLRWLDTRLAAGSLRSRLIFLSLLAAANIILFLLNAANLIPPLWMVTFVIYFGTQSLKYRESSETFDESYTLARQLGQLRVVLMDLEKSAWPPHSGMGKRLAPLRGGESPSAALRRIGRIVSAASVRNNPFLSLALNILVPWDLFFAYQLERYKAALRHSLPGWLETWYETEALTALANFAALNPQNTFPTIQQPGSQPILAARALAHPMIADAIRVPNDFDIRSLGEVTIITGSNMSGKSTFLRTIGANLALAYAGSATPARSLAVVPFRLFTSMNVTDSLNDGISFFYAEVRRLRALMEHLESAGPTPLFFLIDEIFRGTNNRERQIGSHAYTTALAGKNGAGLISTHDLELARLAESIPLVRNNHFREEIADGKMVFDYRIRPGSSPTTNALKIMALAGLPVPASGIEGQPGESRNEDQPA